ncbi:unnamed protein product [Ciceribacter selenitireducens ATCC BAA-1503]|uniref:Uncharacterized protein n=1 Tax=Ciceribacter selenitireducens ATCC BAA-1503 TaxID=1336235 RepID=A0A376AG72_9HYPH|nr:unnamed protein product [Ciceribacter selenitireducens ATCC BAA-1503]
MNGEGTDFRVRHAPIIEDLHLRFCPVLHPPISYRPKPHFLQPRCSKMNKNDPGAGKGMRAAAPIGLMDFCRPAL